MQIEPFRMKPFTDKFMFFIKYDLNRKEMAICIDFSNCVQLDSNMAFKDVHANEIIMG